MNSPLSYVGGKSRLARRIVARIPEDHACYCEPFVGAGWVFFSKKPSRHEVINDLDGELVTFWRVIQNHLEEFLRYYRFAIVSRKIFDLEKVKRPATLTDIQRAVRYLYLQKLAFGGKTTGRNFGTGPGRPANLNLTTLEETLLEVHWRLERVTVENLDGCECIRRYDRPSTFFYIDPPYWHTTGYAVPFEDADYDRLNKVLRGISGRFLLSLNDTVAVRRIFKGFSLVTINTSYTLSRGDCAAHGRGTPRRELLIHNM